MNVEGMCKLVNFQSLVLVTQILVEIEGGFTEESHLLRGTSNRWAHNLHDPFNDGNFLQQVLLGTIIDQVNSDATTPRNPFKSKSIKIGSNQASTVGVLYWASYRKSRTLASMSRMLPKEAKALSSRFR